VKPAAAPAAQMTARPPAPNAAPGIPQQFPAKSQPSFQEQASKIQNVIKGQGGQPAQTNYDIPLPIPQQQASAPLSSQAVSQLPSMPLMDPLTKIDPSGQMSAQAAAQASSKAAQPVVMAEPPSPEAAKMQNVIKGYSQ